MLSMFQEPTISVIMPTLNEGKYLRGALQALKNQSTPPFEIICVDGGSIDETVEIAKEYRVTILADNNDGQDASMNFGATVAKGSILFFLSADVRIFPNTLEKILSCFKSNTQLLALTGVPVPFEAPPLCTIEYSAYNCGKRIFDAFPRRYKRFIESSSFFAVKKTAFQAVGGFQVGNYNSDGLIGRQLQSLGPTLFCQDILYYISARRYNKMGFLQFNRQFIYCIENFIPSLARVSTFNNLRSSAMNLHHSTGQKSASQDNN